MFFTLELLFYVQSKIHLISSKVIHKLYFIRSFYDKVSFIQSRCPLERFPISASIKKTTARRESSTLVADKSRKLQSLP